jgi:hypothetical protein
LVDLDGDGIEDVISGSWPGDIYWFRGKGKRQFEAGRILVPAQKEANDRSGYATLQSAAVAAFDWDGDGLVDLIVGNIWGKVYLLRNIGTKRAPRFAAPVALEADGKPISVGQKAGPCVADWDGDGRPDLIVGSEWGDVVWYRNVGSRQKPVLAGARPLVPKVPEFKEGYRYKPFVVDWNNDGRPDLLVGLCKENQGGQRKTHGYVRLYPRKP